jgi:chemotaxis protein methyltransferase CheR
MVASIDNATRTSAQSVEELEIDLLLEGVFRRFGHDFRGYRRQPLIAKLRVLMRRLGVNTVSALQDRVMHDALTGDALLRALSMRNAAFFDDPAYFIALRAAMVPLLRSCPVPRIWIAECVSAEEVCALAIMLVEEGLYDKTQIFATTANDALLQEASQGSFARARLPEYTQNYRKIGGRRALDDYCCEANDMVVFSSQLRSNITWAQYNLTTDASFNEFQLIICRSALPEFGMLLRCRTLQLFYESMPVFGILGVGCDVGVDATPLVSRYQPVAKEQGVYRRVV